MLNYETILSAYDDKLTLMQWLKKVEDALNNASAVAFNVTKTGDATLTFSLDFEDGSKIESGPIVLQQGESVESAAITNGHLFLTLTNGDVLDAGNIFNGDLSLSGNLSVSGTLSAPTLTTTGDEISAQKPVVEVMTGYSAQETAETDHANLTTTPIYFGAVKNGNKLTLVYALKVTRTGPVSVENRLLRVTIPAAIGAKIYPVNVAGYAKLVDFKPLAAAYSYRSANTSASAMVSKENNTTLEFWLIDPSTFTENLEHYIRIETTLLLSENLLA